MQGTPEKGGEVAEKGGTPEMEVAGIAFNLAVSVIIRFFFQTKSLLIFSYSFIFPVIFCLQIPIRTVSFVIIS